MTLIASTTMGLESIVAQELKKLGYKDINTLNGKVEFTGTYRDICKGNINLRCADRLYVKMGEFKATTQTELFDGIKNIGWEKIMPIDANFPISWISTVKSELNSERKSQASIKKAIATRLEEKYKTTELLERGAKYAVKVQINKNNVVVMIDTSGEGLNKRGYRAINNLASIKETLAAGLVLIARWDGYKPLIDPTCGTGTILIEAAMIARNIAPGANRKFESEKWDVIPSEFWIEERDEAYSREDNDKKIEIYGSDIDGEIIKVAKENAKLAGVEDDIVFEQRHLLEVENYIKAEKGTIICNPPYGERMGEKEDAIKTTRILGDVCRRFPKWNYYVISSLGADRHKNGIKFEEIFGQKFDKNRKLYNGGIMCYYYQFFGNRKNVFVKNRL
ncbi:THUMP domain-containing class I SAM-dependent RNA methyltransferase [Haliovirga abyssi]|uniref:THUMP domain-containing class I SAM-dependent RNA methyltransferase n=1 Tax=Haliovirga abyssi TaxID=2996794 RepID=UPI0027DE78A4|nr:class I SAM-dependent RNA methyltransferase [Haliovirga abyssi]